MRRITCSLALVLLASTLAVATPAVSSASSKVGITVKLSNSSPAISKTIEIKVCWRNAASGDSVQLDEESTASLSWFVKSTANISASNGCKSWSRSSGSIGEYPYRAEVRQGHSLLSTSPIETDRTFGTISAKTFFISELGCQGGGTVTTPTQTYSYFCTLSAGAKASSNFITFLHPTTCRSLTLRMTATDNSRGSPTDKSNVVVEIIQGGSAQPAFIGSNNLENFTYQLNGSVSALNVWASPGFSTGEAVYFLVPGSTAFCSTSTGV